MRTIKISEEVWQTIADNGKFGEIEDDVLRRILKLPSDSIHERHRILQTHRRLRATRRMSSYIGNNQLNVEFNDGASSSWTLPDRNDKMGIRSVLDKAISFARTNEATLGQVNAVRKTLTDEGYHLTK